MLSAEGKESKKFGKFGKDPTVETGFLPDRCGINLSLPRPLFFLSLLLSPSLSSPLPLLSLSLSLSLSGLGVNIWA